MAGPWRSLSAALLAAIGIASSARAALIPIDLFVPGDALASRDVVRGIDWLDLPQTAGLSIDDVLQGAGGWIAQGWRLARTAEVCGLAGDVFGASVLCGGGTSSASIRFDDRSLGIIDLRGATLVGPQTVRVADGVFDDGDLSDLEGARASYIFFVNSQGGDQSQFNYTELSGTGFPSIFSRSPFVGVLLVRPIPEPGTAGLVTLGLLALSLRRAAQRTRP